MRGEEGRLLYLGYDIDDLVEMCCFEEVVYLLLNKRLPNREELEGIKKRLRSDRDLPQPILDFFKTATKSARPMSALRTAVSMLGMYDDRTKDAGQLKEIGLSLIAKVPVMVAYYYRLCQGLELPPVREDLSEAEHFLWLLKGEEPDQDEAHILEVAYILHADHGMNASTFAARVCIATLSDMYSAITAAIGTLKGPLHGGANEGVIEMLKEIGTEDRVDSYIEDKLARKEKSWVWATACTACWIPAPRICDAWPSAFPPESGTQVDPHVGTHRETCPGAQGLECQCGFLFRHGLLQHRDPHQAVYRHFLHCPL